MKLSGRLIVLLAFSSTLVACQSTGAGMEAAGAQGGQGAHSDAHALAQAACAGCHSVERFGLSPNTAAPEFPLIANRRGLTVSTLTNWLRNAHNYPEEMDFYLEDDEVGELVDYILTLKDDDYEPPIQ